MNRIIIIIIVFFSTIGWFGCYRNIKQYKPISDQDTILMIGKVGGNDFFIKRNNLLNSDSFYLQIKQYKKNLKIVSYTLNIFGSDIENYYKSDKIPIDLFDLMKKFNNAKSFCIYSIVFLDENGIKHSIDRYKTYSCWVKKHKFKKVKM